MKTFQLHSINRINTPVAWLGWILAASTIWSPVANAGQPFVDVVQFSTEPQRRVVATEHHKDWGRQKQDHPLSRFVPMVDRALGLNKDKLLLRRSPNGKWIPSTAQFTAQDQSFLNASYLGRIIASKNSDFVVRLTEDGVVTGTETGATDDFLAAGTAFHIQGTMRWKGTETLDLRSGADEWRFEAQLDGQFGVRRPNGGFAALRSPVAAGTLTASDSQHREFKLVRSIDQLSAANGAVATDAPGSDGLLAIGELKLTSATGSSVLRFNDRATLTVPLANHAGLDLNELSGTVTTADRINGILEPNKLSVTSRVANDAKVEVPFAIGTDFSVPTGAVNLVVTFSQRNTVVARKTISVPTEGFYRNTNVRVPDSASARLRVIAKYFGASDVESGDPASELSAESGQGDQLAAMWEAVFTYQGAAGYVQDPDKAYVLARRVLHTVEERARDGDVEAIFLMFYACQMGLEGQSAEAAGVPFLERAAQAGFLPARFEHGRLLSYRNDFTNSAAELKAAYDAGAKKAAVLLGQLYARGLGVERDPKAAAQWYSLGVDFGDPEALLVTANMIATGSDGTPPDPGKAMELAVRAASRRYSGAYLFIGDAYASGRQGVKRDAVAAVKALTTASELGDRQAMLALSELYFSTAPDLIPNEKAGWFWAKKAADRGSPAAMVVVANGYREGRLVEKNVVATRYWWNQAALHGAVKADNAALQAQLQSFMDFWRYADFSPSSVYVNEYTGRVSTSGDGGIHGLVTGGIGAMLSYYGSQQPMIDGVELIGTKNGRKIYGGTISSRVVSRLLLKAGATVSIHSYGVISTGLMSGLADADGLGPNYPEYRIVPYIPCSAVMGRIGDGAWQLIGTGSVFAAAREGTLSLAINAVDVRNYKGYFDVVIEIPDEQ